MGCTKLEDFDKENPNYRLLAESMDAEKVKLLEDECKALIYAPPLDVKFALGMQAYLQTQGYDAHIAGFPESPS